MRSGKLRFLMAPLAALLLLTAFSWPVASPALPIPPPIIVYTGVWQGQTVNLTNVTNVTVEQIPGARNVGQITGFYTNQPQGSQPPYYLLNGKSINVWTVDNPNYPQFAGVYVVHDGGQGPEPVYGTWTFPGPSQKQNLTLSVSVSPGSFTANQTQTVNWSVALSQAVNDGTIAISVTSPGGQTTQIESGSAPTNGNYSYTNDELFNAAGTWTVNASWSGDSQYNPASGSTTVTVTSGTSSVSLTLTASPNPLSTSQSGTLTATLNQPVNDGTVTFTGSGPNGATFPTNTRTPVNGTCSLPYQTGAAGTWTITASWSGDSQYSPASGSTTVTVTAPAYTYTGTINGQPVTLTHVPNVTVEGLSDATLQHFQLDDFQTNDPAYTSLIGENINVFTAPNEFPGVDVVHNGLMGNQPVYGTWTFTPPAQNYTYTGTINGQPVTLTHVPNVTVEGLSDHTLLPTQLNNFQTNDPTYTALNGENINVFTAPAEFPGVDVVHNGLMGNQPVYGTWTFTPPAAAGAVAAYKVDVNSPQNFGAPFTFTVTAVDASGNTVTSADNSVALSSSTNNVNFTSARTAPGKRAWVKLVNGTVTVHAQDPVQEATTITAASWAGGTVQGSAQLTVAMGIHPTLWTPGVDMSINGGPTQRVGDINFIDYLNGVKTSGQHGGFWPLGVGTTYTATWTGTLQVFWPGTYQVLNVADDSGSATITVGGKTITIPENSWTSGTNEPVSLTLKRGSYAVSVTQQETDGQGGAGDTLEWQPYWRKSLVPIPALYFRSGQTPPNILPDSIAFTIGSNQYVAGGSTQTVDTAPFIQKGRTYLSLRAMGYALGMSDRDIVWNPENHTATFDFNGQEVVFTLGSQTYMVDGEPQQMDVSPIDVNGRIFVPGRFFANAFSYQVGWNAQNQQVTFAAPSGEAVYHPNE